MRQETLPDLLLLKISFYSLYYQSYSITLDLNANIVSPEHKVRMCGGKDVSCIAQSKCSLPSHLLLDFTLKKIALE